MKKALLRTAIAAFVVSMSSAQGGIQGGDLEVQIQGAVQTVTADESDSTTTMAQLGLNKYFSSWFSLGVTFMPMVTTTSSDGSDETTSSSIFLMVRPDFYIAGGSSPVVPYVGPHAGLVAYESSSSDYDSSGSSVAGGLHAGVKIFASEKASWNLELNGTAYTADSDGGSSADISVVSFLVGMSYRF